METLYFRPMIAAGGIVSVKFIEELDRGILPRVAEERAE
jgi:hypothetical protein